MLLKFAFYYMLLIVYVSDMYLVLLIIHICIYFMHSNHNSSKYQLKSYYLLEKCISMIFTNYLIYVIPHMLNIKMLVS